MKKKNMIMIVSVILLSLLIIFIRNYFLNGEEKTQNKDIKKYSTQYSDYGDILNEENYRKVGINPEKYAKFDDFLKDLKSFSGVSINLLEDDFVIGIENSSGSITYVPFRKENKSIFDDKTNKNLAILDIYTSYKKGLIYGGGKSSYGSKIVFDKDVMHKETETLRQIFGKNTNIYEVKDELEKFKNLGDSKKELLAYLYDFTGDYGSGNKLRIDLCKESETSCSKTTEITLSGKILNNDNSPVVGATVSLLNDSKIKTISDNAGNYKLTFKWSAFSHIRFKASKLGYSDGFFTLSINSSINNKWPNNYNTNFTLNRAQKTLTVDENNFKNYKKGGFYVFESTQSKYFVPMDGLYYMDGKNYEDKYLSVYMYELNKWSHTENLLSNDTFTPVAGYVGNIMKTFGMPYIQFFDKNGVELFVKSSNPIILQNQIYHMKELYENYDKIYQALKKEDMKYLVKVSNESNGYPIDFDFLTKNNFLRWPGWWCLDRKTGVWGSVGHKVINENGLVELPFYSIKDTK